jgi:1-acyl-sn-glycerol-3-phosphate acyltransferase
MYYFIGWILFLIFFKLYLGFRVVGRENIPSSGAFIFVSNHGSYLDPILLGTALYRSLNYMAREELFSKPIADWIMRSVHSFPVKRGKGDLGAIRQALRILGSGKPLVIFPEGTRAEDDNLRRAKPGIGFIVSKAGVPVVPAYIGVSHSALPRGSLMIGRYPVAVYIGKPIIFDKDNFRREDEESYQKIADEVMAGIAGIKKMYVDKAC